MQHALATFGVPGRGVGLVGVVINARRPLEPTSAGSGEDLGPETAFELPSIGKSLSNLALSLLRKEVHVDRADQFACLTGTRRSGQKPRGRSINMLSTSADVVRFGRLDPQEHISPSGFAAVIRTARKGSTEGGPQTGLRHRWTKHMSGGDEITSIPEMNSNHLAQSQTFKSPGSRRAELSKAHLTPAGHGSEGFTHSNCVLNSLCVTLFACLMAEPTCSGIKKCSHRRSRPLLSEQPCISHEANTRQKLLGYTSRTRRHWPTLRLADGSQNVTLG